MKRRQIIPSPALSWRLKCLVTGGHRWGYLYMGETLPHAKSCVKCSALDVTK